MKGRSVFSSRDTSRSFENINLPNVLMSWSSLPFFFAQATQAIIPGAGVQANNNNSADGDVGTGILMIGILIAVFVIPFVIGHFLSKRLKMPTYGGSIGIILAAVIGSICIFATNELRYGPDISGGTNLIYELDKTQRLIPDGSGARITAKDLMEPLRERLNPAGTNELIIRPSGDDQIEIIVPNKDQFEVDQIKREISEAGILEFRIVANSNDHKNIIDLARRNAESPAEFDRLAREVRDENGKLVGLWRPIGREDMVQNGVRALRTSVQQGVDLARDSSTGRLLPMYPGSTETNGFEKWLDRQGIERIDILLALEKAGTEFPEVTGSDIASARVDASSNGGYEVVFNMRPSGASKLSKLTLRNQPDPNTDFHRRMAILLDGRVLSAPQLNQPISTNGVITGNFSRTDADFLQKILQAGSLPAALNKTPVSENQISATMGKNAIQKGAFAAIAGLITTALFMLVYYRFSGIVACIALAINLMLIVAFIIIIRQPITMPGLAGLVLSVGMSVDANVLVFERIREEIAKRSTGRLAIRNGFDRAITTIIDSNLTTLISAVVLYWVGTDQVRGFAITLIIGILASMFTAVFCSRVIFEICERHRLVSFGMSDIVGFLRKKMLGEKDFDFMAWRKLCYGISFIAMAVGIIGPALRGRQILDIDFNGGTSVVFVLNKSMPTEEVRNLTTSIFDVDDQNLPIQSTLTSVQIPDLDERVYKLDTSLKSVDEVTKRLVEGFQATENGARLQTYSVNAEVKPGTEDSGRRTSNLRLKFVNFQEENPAEAAGDITAETSPTDSAEVTEEVDLADPEAAVQEETSTTVQQDTPENESPTAVEAGAEANAAASNLRTMIDLSFNAGDEGAAAKINASGLIEKLILAGKQTGLELNETQIRLQPKDAKDWTPDSEVGYPEWVVSLPLDTSKSQEVIDNFKTQLADEPIWQSVAKIDSRVAGEMQTRAILALVVSMVFITAYIWFRFQKIAYGIAALIALVHDVLITLAFVAISHWLFRPLGFLLLDDFKISLNMIAAFLTIIGYSLNDTIVVFDRIREVKGKAPKLTSEMINQSVNQTLSRTLLTSSTTIVAVLLLYILGGEAVHGFSFALLIGILVGTYSSIFIAAPLLLWFAQREEAKRELKSV